MLRIVSAMPCAKCAPAGGTSPRQNKVAPSAWCASRSSAGSGTRWAKVRSCSPSSSAVCNSPCAS